MCFGGLAGLRRIVLMLYVCERVWRDRRNETIVAVARAQLDLRNELNQFEGERLCEFVIHL